MQRSDKTDRRSVAVHGSLGRHLAIAPILKSVIVVLLCRSFIKPHRIKIDVQALYSHPH
jgi:hypothetical protein